MMKAVLVKHTEDGKPYCFGLPDWFDLHINIGTRVLCQTRRGVTDGVIVSNVCEGALAEDMARRNGATFPLSKIKEISINMKLDDLLIPEAIRNSHPSPRKIQQRSEEYSKYGRFLNRIAVSKHNVLYDGYTAYLVAKKLGLDSIEAMKPVKGLMPRC